MRGFRKIATIEIEKPPAGEAEGAIAMRFHVLGSCSGTEPMPGRHHTSIALEVGEGLYFLDAGENCAYSSYLLGLDQLSTKAVFISHTHMDHVGGLPNLLWNLRKLCTIDPANMARMEGKRVQVFIPDLDVFDGVRNMLLGSEGGYNINFTLEPQLIADGLLLDDGLKVTAFHNHHLGVPSPGQLWKSYSFLLEAERKRAVYSGDFGELSELLPYIDGSDLVFLETGHHRACKLCRELVDSGAEFGRVAFFHHGVEILRDFEGELALARDVLEDRVEFAQDGTVWTL